MEQQNQTDLLQEVQEEMNYVDPVSRGVRLANFIIDRIAVVSIIYCIQFVWEMLSPSMRETINAYLSKQDSITLWMIDMMISVVFLLLYYSLFEAATRGRTLGKILTGTSAITQDGSSFTFKHALLRTLCRFIPFEPLSALGYMPWHDSLTHTAVVKKTW
jgi:uncharacterized RDD family membrane protein YckC